MAVPEKNRASAETPADGAAYEPPAVRVLGAVHLITRQDKKFGSSDGYTFLGSSITNNSP